jgi:hypothetical protein
VRNLGASVAYDVKIRWDEHPKDEAGEDVTALDDIPVLLPQAEPQTLVGQTRILLQRHQSMRFGGVIDFKDATGKKFTQRFKCSADEYRHGQVYENDMTQTLKELQKLPEGLKDIVKAIKDDVD